MHLRMKFIGSVLCNYFVNALCALMQFSFPHDVDKWKWHINRHVNCENTALLMAILNVTYQSAISSFCTREIVRFLTKLKVLNYNSIVENLFKSNLASFSFVICYSFFHVNHSCQFKRSKPHTICWKLINISWSKYLRGLFNFNF